MTNCGGGGGGQPTVPANQGDQRGAGHSMMQGGGGGSNLSCQLLQAASRATPTQVTRPRQQACSQAVGDVAKERMSLLVISTLSIAMITVIACVHSGYITVTMTATATAIVQTTLTLTTTVTTVASSSASRCNSSTAAQQLKLPALPPRPCVLQLHHSWQNHSTSQERGVKTHRHVRQQWRRRIAGVAGTPFWTSFCSGIRRTRRPLSGGTTAPLADGFRVRGVASSAGRGRRAQLT